MTSTRGVWGVFLVAACLAVASPAAAQEEVLPKLSVMGGYSFLKDPSWQTNLKYGWVVAIAQKVGNRVSVVAEGGGNYDKYGTTTFRIARYSVLGGIKLQGGGDGPRPFVQVLVGLSRQAGDVGIDNGFALQPGGGIDFRLTDRLSVRGFGDYRFLREEGTRWHQFRFGGGVLFKIWQ